MKKLMPVLGAAALMFTACGGGGGGASAATVNGSPISVGDVESVPFQTDGTMAPADFNQYLGALIQWQILDDAAATEFGIDPSEEEVATELEELLAQLGGVTAEEIGAQENISEQTLSRIARAGLIQEAVGAELAVDVEAPTEDEIAEAKTVAVAQATEICARHLLVATEEEATTARDRIEGGEAFGDVASEVSIDPSAAENGGDLSCAPAGNYVEPFRDASVVAEIDALTDPVETQFGFHIIQVYERTDPAPEDLPTEDEVRDGLLQQAGSGLLEEWSTRITEEAVVEVDEEYGTWSTSPPGVVAPQT